MSWGRAFRLPLLTLGLLCACSDGRTSDAAASDATESPGVTQPPASPSLPSAAGANSAAPETNPAQRTAAPPATMGSTPTAGTNAQDGAAGAVAEAGAAAPELTPLGPGMCCPDGECLCRAEPPSALSAAPGPHNFMQYPIEGLGCVFYPTDARPPYAAVAIADGFGGSGGCDSVQTQEWGPLYASHGIVSMIVEGGTGDQASARSAKLLEAIAAFKAENEKNDSPLFGKLAGRYGTSGFSTGGTASVLASEAEPSLRSSVAIMPWGAAQSAGSVPTLIVCGDSDGVAPCSAYGSKTYAAIGGTVPKLRVTIASGHNGQPSAADGATGARALAFQKLFLEGDERWRPLVIAAPADESTIK